MDQTGPSSTALLPFTGRADWVIIGLIGFCALAAEGCAYLWGVYWNTGSWILGTIGAHFTAFVLWVTLFFMPLLDPRKGSLALRLSIRAGLLILAFGIWRLPGSLTETPAYVLGCKNTLESSLPLPDFDFIRRKVAEKRKQDPDLLLIQPEANDLPTSFTRLNRPLPNYIEVRDDSASRKYEIQVEWGGSQVGRHGLLIDPINKPSIGREVNPHAVTVWHYRLADGIYFYASSE
jgi:hypothetical protein